MRSTMDEGKAKGSKFKMGLDQSMESSKRLVASRVGLREPRGMAQQRPFTVQHNICRQVADQEQIDGASSQSFIMVAHLSLHSSY